jgi:hypothetical protein
MLTSLASIQLESDSRRFGNPNRFIPVGKCSRTKQTVSLERELAQEEIAIRAQEISRL